MRMAYDALVPEASMCTIFGKPCANYDHYGAYAQAWSCGGRRAADAVDARLRRGGPRPEHLRLLALRPRRAPRCARMGMNERLLPGIQDHMSYQTCTGAGIMHQNAVRLKQCPLTPVHMSVCFQAMLCEHAVARRSSLSTIACSTSLILCCVLLSMPDAQAACA